MSLRVCCIDDSPLCLHGLRQCISAAGHTIVGELDRFSQLDEFLSRVPCDVLVSEVHVRGLDVFYTCQWIIDKYPGIRLIIYSYDDNPTHIARASALNAWDYVPKRFAVQRLIQACESVPTGQRCSDSLIGSAKQFLQHHHKPVEKILPPLTKREYQILIHLSLGLSNREIGKSLSIGMETVKEHVQNVLRKLQFNDRTAAAIWSLKNGVPTLSCDTHA